jgi:tetratricopeptide (TPR) repeat protein
MLSRIHSLISKIFGPQVETDTSPGHTYSLARHQTLVYERQFVAALAPFPEPSPDAPAWGVVMEIAYPGFSGTLATFSNGQTILYNSNGQGVPREDNNEQIRRAGAKLITAANKAIPYLKPSTTCPLPAPWQSNFYIRTDSGNLVTEATAEDFRNENHPLFSFFAAANDLLTEMKLAAAAQQKDFAVKRIVGLSDAIAQHPTAEDHAMRAEYYGELGEFDKALEDFEHVVSLLPVADAFLGRGCMYMKRGDLASALSDFNHAVEMEPTNAMAYSNRAAAYSRLDDMENALANYDLAILHDPNYATAYANRAFAYYKLGRYMDGVNDCNRALALKPDNANTYNNRGLCLAGLGDKEAARADFQRALEFDPRPPASVIQEALNGLHALDHPGEPLPVWQSPSVWVLPS